MKVHVFESEPWITAVWQSHGTDLECIWIEDMLTPELAHRYQDARIIHSDVSLLDEPTLRAFKNLELIALRSTGVDQVDLDYCAAHRIVVCNVPVYAQHAVAEHVFALLLALCRHVVPATRQTRGLDFSWDGIQGWELFGRTMAVIGTGAIGKRVAVIARGFGMCVAAFDKFPDEAWALENGIRYLPLDDALRRADVVSLHVPSSTETYHLISSGSLAQLPDGAVIINTARGDLVDPQALLDALASGKIAAAGLDVLPQEVKLLKFAASGPHRSDGMLDPETDLLLRLVQHPRVLVTPHCAFFTREAAERLIQNTIGNIEAFLNGRPQNVVGPHRGTVETGQNA